MNYLSDDLLIDAYEKALELDLDDYFIQLLSDELHHRDIHDQTNDLCTV
nr:sporulation histidine kinase inhibitor Sda [Aquibacillus sediminis]